MSDQYKPAGRQAISPFICVLDFQEFLEFVQKGLGATIAAEQKNDKGDVILATLKIDDSTVHIMEAWNAESATPAMLYFYVPDVAEAVARAVAAGAETSEGGPNPFGDEHGVVTDKWNNFWWFAKNAGEKA